MAVNRIGDVGSPEFLTIEEYNRRFLAPAAEEMRRQWAADAAYWGWQPRSWWRRLPWSRMRKAAWVSWLVVVHFTAADCWWFWWTHH